MGDKVGQLELEVKEWMDKMPLVNRIVKIERELKRLEQACD